ncbi:unnamed protein product [Notodromas monacha]|uniref:Uncharacterized protein n=1 Tax=Notodromas monacha TaxID=399045 RepID=A0A7R9BU25_9CRUS|nr:unnamed protein product [Notodromas monacha]CAG0921759.1 unnamed protein product [Notodromas monacha]
MAKLLHSSPDCGEMRVKATHVICAVPINPCKQNQRCLVPFIKFFCCFGVWTLLAHISGLGDIYLPQWESDGRGWVLQSGMSDTMHSIRFKLGPQNFDKLKVANFCNRPTRPGENNAFRNARYSSTLALYAEAANPWTRNNCLPRYSPGHELDSYHARFGSKVGLNAGTLDQGYSAYYYSSTEIVENFRAHAN